MLCDSSVISIFIKDFSSFMTLLLNLDKELLIEGNSRAFTTNVSPTSKVENPYFDFTILGMYKYNCFNSFVNIKC